MTTYTTLKDFQDACHRHEVTEIHNYYGEVFGLEPHIKDGQVVGWYYSWEDTTSDWRNDELVPSGWVAMVPPELVESHDWRTCQCESCVGQRAANVFMTTPCRFTP